MTTLKHDDDQLELKSHSKPSHTQASLTLILEDFVRHLARQCSQERFKSDQPDFTRSANDERW